VSVVVAIFVLVLVVRDDGVEETSLLCKGNKEVVDARKESGRTDFRDAAIEKADDNDDKEEMQTQPKILVALNRQCIFLSIQKKFLSFLVSWIVEAF